MFSWNVILVFGLKLEIFAVVVVVPIAGGLLGSGFVDA